MKKQISKLLIVLLLSIVNIFAIAQTTTINYSGTYTSYTVPAGVTSISIETFGAQGGAGYASVGGLGARMKGNFTVTPGQVLKVLVGGQGGNGTNQGGGGGGTFVTDNSNNPLCISGGGGGANYGSYPYLSTNANAPVTTSGMPGINAAQSTISGAGGIAPNGGGVDQGIYKNGGAGGGGLVGNGSDAISLGSSIAKGGLSFINGGTGGAGTGSPYGGSGGFGGGGGADWIYYTGGGGGGGYAGGGGGTYYGVGGGGGSYNGGTSQSNTAGTNSGNGKVIITVLITPATGLNFDGANDYVNLNNNILTANQSYTKEAWIFANASSSNNIISSPDAPFWLAGNKLSAAHGWTGSSLVVADPATFPLGQWVHVAVTYDAPTTTMKLYKNGVLVASNASMISYTAGEMHIGAYLTGNYFNGSIDEARIWNRALCASEIVNNLNCSLNNVGQSGLLALYHFDQGVVNANNAGITTLTDATGTYNGTLVNFGLTGATSNWTNGNTTGTCSSFVIPTTPITGTTTVCLGVSSTLSNTNTGGTWTSSNTAVATINASTGVVSTISAGTTTITYTNTCGGVSTTTFTVNALPTATINGTVNVCQNSSAPTITFTGANGTAPYTFTYTINSAAQQTVVSTGNTATVNAPTGVVGTYAYALVSVKDASSTTCANAITGRADIVVRLLPQISGIAGNTSICSGTATILTASSTNAPTATFKWYDAASGGVLLFSGAAYTTPILTTNTTYYVEASVGPIGCTSPSRTAITVTVNPLPTPTISAGGSTTFCAGGSVTLTASAGSSFQWSNGATTQAITTSVADSYTVTVTNASGCSASSAATVVTVNPLPTITGTLVSCAGRGRQLTGSGTPAASNPWTSSDPSVATVDNTGFVTGVAVAGGTAVITYTNSNGCSITASFTVPPLPPTPTVSVVNNCDGTSTLTASGYTSYQWALSGGPITATTTSITVTTTGTYVVRSASSQCVSSFASGIAAPKTTPIANISATGSTSVCPGNTVSLHANTGTGFTYQWFKDGNIIVGAISADYSATTSGSYTVVITNNGCASAASNAINVTVQDITAPNFTTPYTILTPVNGSGEVTATSAYGATVIYILPQATDACSPNPTVIGTPASGSTFAIGTTTVTVIAIDATGNQATTTFTVTVIGEAPVINCPANITVNNTPGQCGAIVNFAATETTGVPASTITYSHASGTFFPVGTTTVTATATNAVGASSCSFNVIVVDNQAPNFTSSFNILTPNVAGTVTATGPNGAMVMYALPNASDNCSGLVNVTGTPASGSTFPIGTNVVTVVATDNAGNISTNTYNIIVSGLAPAINCPPNIAVNSTAGLCGANVSYTATETTGVPASTITYSTPSGNFFAVGTYTITATATNAVGSSSCTFTVTVKDVKAPVINTLSFSAPTNILTNVPEAAQYQLVYKLPIPNTADWNTGSTIPYSVNNAAALASSTFGRVAYYMELDNKWVWVSMDKFTNNVALTGIPTGSTFFQQKVNNLNVLSSTGAGLVNGNSIATGNIELWSNCYSTSNAAAIPGASNSVYDFGDIMDQVDCYGSFQVHNYGAAQTLFAYNRWSTSGNSDIGIGNNPSGHPDWTFTTNAGGFATKNLYVFISGGIHNITANVDAGQCSKIVTITTPVATDDCGTPTVTGVRSDNLALNAAYPVGVTTITWTATDASLNATSAPQTITVVDNIVPTITCPSNITVNASSPSGAVVSFATPTASDNCSANVAQTAGLASGATFPIGINTITYKATDPSGNNVSCSFTITVSGLAPVIVCPSNITVNNAVGQCGANVPFAATDNTGIPASTITYSEAGNPVTSGSFFSVGTHTINAVATNAVGNSTCSFTITVVDNQPPVIICPANINVNNETGKCGSAINIVAATATDNCGNPTVVGVRSDSQPLSADYPVGTTTITWTATDVHGLTSSCIQSINVNDTEKPTIVCPVAQTVNLNANCSATLPDFRSLLTANDNCTATNTLVITQTPIAGTSLTFVGTLTVTFTVTDASNNSSSCTIVVTKKDVTPPTIVCTQPINTVNDPNNCGAVVTFVTPTATDNCSGPTGSQTFTYTGSIVNYTVPAGVNSITIQAKGAQGGNSNGGAGAIISGTVSVTPGQVLKVLVGGQGQIGSSRAGGGGGSYVITSSNTPLVIAGGGGGAGVFFTNPGLPAQTGTSGGNSRTALGGLNGNGGAGGNLGGNGGCGNPGDGGGGLLTNGGGDIISGGRAFVNGGAAGVDGTANCIVSPSGGFGGGGAGGNGGGGGGGYSGGAGGDNDFNGNYPGGGGGGSYNAGSNPINTIGNTGNGQVIISYASVSATVTQTSGLPSGSVYPIGTTTNTYVATDASGNTSSCSFDVTVVDNQPPVIVCPGNVSVIATSASGAVVNYSTPIGTDNCGGVITTMINGLSSGATFPIGTTVVTYKATDAAGLTATCSFNVTVTGLLPVIHCPANIVVNNTPGQCGANVDFTATETVGIPASVITYSVEPNTFFSVGTHTITATATNAVGSSSCTFDITVIDNENPTVVSAGDQTQFTDLGDCGAVVTVVPPTTGDNCAVASVVNSYNNLSDASGHYPVGTTTITWTVTDIHDNVSTTTQNITVVDNQFPVLIGVPSNITVECDAVPAPAVVTATDNCSTSIPSFTEVRTDGNCPSNYTLTRTWSTSDASENTTSLQQVITVQDLTAPVITCPSNITIPAEQGQCSAVVGYTATATDNCGTVQIIYSIEPGSRFSVGTQTVMATATDACGNVSHCSFDVTVVDNQLPNVITQNLTVYVDANGQATITPQQVNNGSTDNCGIATLTLNKSTFDCSDVVTAPVAHNSGALSFDGQNDYVQIGGNIPGGSNFSFSTWFYPTNGNNGKLISSGSIEVCVCSGTIEVYTPGGGMFGGFGISNNTWHNIVVSYSFPLGKVYIDGVLKSTFSASPIGTIASPRIGTHVAANCCRFPGFIDEMSTWNKTLTPADIANMQTQSLSGTESGLTGYWSFDEGTGTVAVDHSTGGHNGTLMNMNTLTAWSSFKAPVGSGLASGTGVILTVTDIHGNSASAPATITVLDNINPVIDPAPASVTVECNAVPVAAVLNATDNCSAVVTMKEVRTNGNCPSNYTLTRTWTATDPSGNHVSVSQTITVQDTQAPILSASPADVTVECNAVPVADILTATDNCDAPTVNYTEVRTNGSSVNNYTLTRTWTATDACGNASSKTQVITVQDTQAPIITLTPANIAVNTDNNVCGAVVSFAATATDVCGPVVITYSQNPGTLFALGTTVVTVTATDPSGNFSTSSFEVKVSDVQKPNVITQNITVYLDQSGHVSITAAQVNNGSSDACGIATMSVSPNTFDCSKQGPNTVTLTVTDVNGNVQTATAIVTVQDKLGPVPTLASLPSVSGQCSAGVEIITYSHHDDDDDDDHHGWIRSSYNWWNNWDDDDHHDGDDDDDHYESNELHMTTPTAMDNCSGLIKATTTDPLFYYTQGVHIIHWKFVDAKGNVTIQEQTVTVDDTQAPVPYRSSLQTISGQCSVTVGGNGNDGDDDDDCGENNAAPWAKDNCKGWIRGTTIDPLTYTSQGIYTIHWTFNDGNGNISTQNQTVIVKDNTAPKPVVSSLPTLTGQCSVTVTTVPKANDNCVGLVTGTTSSPLTYTNQGTYTIVWSYTDGRGNVSTQTQKVVVDDDIKPVPVVATLPTITGECSATVTAVPKANDNCKGLISATTTDPLTYTGEGTYTIKWTYNDGNGNVTTQNQTVVINDVTAPVPQVAVLPTITAECSATVTAPKANDNCKGVITATTGDATTYTKQGTYTIKWTYNDGNGNITTQNQTVIIDDNTKPTLVVPNNATVSCGSSTSPSATGTATATDNCSGSIAISYSDVTVGTVTTRTWKATDAAGNVTTGTQTITSVDNINPVIADVKDVTVACGSSTAPSVTGTPKATDNCSTPTVTYTDVVTASNITRTWTATDAAGNTSSSVQVISFSAAFNVSISSVPTSSVYTGGVSTNLYLGYGAQSTALTVCSLPSAGAPYTYAWTGSAINTLSNTNSSAPVFTPSTPGTYQFTVTVTNKNGCKDVSTLSLCVTDIRVVGTSGANAKVYVCHTPNGKNAVAQTLQLLVSQVASHIGNNNCGGNGYDRLGSCDQTPCVGAVSTATVAVSTGMAKEVTTVAATTEEELKVTVMPNPSTTYFTLKLESKYQTPVELRVMDGAGRVVDAKSKLGANSSVQIGHNYSSGTYYAELIQGTTRKVVQLIKARG